MEDPDVITRAQLALAICGRRNCRAGKHVGKKEQPRAVEEVGNIGIYLYSGSYVLAHTVFPRRALLRRIFWTAANRRKNMQRTRSAVIGALSPDYYVLLT